MMLQQKNTNNYTKNYIMDNPDVTINDLFVDVKKSFAKFQQKQKLDKERRQKKKKEARAAKSNSASPLFGSQLNPQWNTKAESFSSTDSTAMAASSSTSYKDEETVTEKQLSTSSSADHPPPPPPKKSMSESILAMLGSSSSYKSPPAVPDESELRRREEVAAAIRLKAAQLHEEQLKEPPKPLVWSKPSFNFPSKDDGTNRSGDDDSKMAAQPDNAVESSTSSSSAVSKQNQFSGRKRKSDLGDESPDTATTAAALPISNNCYHRPMRGAALYTTSAAALPPQQTMTIRGKWRSTGSVTYSLSKSVPINGLVSYTNQYQPSNPDEYSKEDVDGLVQFAQKYITAENMKRRRTK